MKIINNRFLQPALFSILTSLIVIVSCEKTPNPNFNPNDSEDSTIFTFCKIWGFLKYYHPNVTSGSIDWDKEFIKNIRVVVSLKTKDECSQYYLKWINSLGEIRDIENNVDTASSRYLECFRWINDTSLLSTELSDKLNYIFENRAFKDNYYGQKNSMNVFSSKHEKAYEDSLYPSKEMRLLSLSRYWNIINYFYPYKYILDENWDDVLLKMIPIFLNTNDTISYNLALMNLIANTNDSHAIFMNKYTDSYFGSKVQPFSFNVIDSIAIVSRLYDSVLCNAEDIKVGDIFLTIDGKKITTKVDEVSKYISSSNPAAKVRDCSFYIFNSNKDSIPVSFDREGEVKKKYLQTYSLSQLHFTGNSNSEIMIYKLIDKNIGYINLGLLHNFDVDSVMKALYNTTAIIFDARYYPNETIEKLTYYLNFQRRPFASIVTPDFSNPGLFKPSELEYCGGKNPNPYRGLVILLFNEWSQSQGEYTIMALQTSSKVISIGSQTAGTDGNVSQLVFPGNYKTYMSGIGIYYPDGRPTQRVGITPDIEVKPSILGIRKGKDEILERAIQVANEK